MSIVPRFFNGRRGDVFDPFSLNLWVDPLRVFPFGGGDSNAAVFADARIDWKETPEAHVFKADLPSVKKEEVKMEVEEGGVFRISGERSKEEEEKSDRWHRIERSRSRFIRRFRLPKNAKASAMKAVMKNGVLTVTVPKEKEMKKPEVMTIEISG